MDLLGAVVAFGCAVGTFVLKLVIREAEDWLPVCSRNIIARAAERLPESQRNRYREEWLAHADELPGPLGKLIHSLGCYFSACQWGVTTDDAEDPYGDIRIELAHGLTLWINSNNFGTMIIVQPHPTGTGNPGTIMNTQALSIYVRRLLDKEQQKASKRLTQRDWDRIVSDIRTTFAV
jgi:hypothetical protein